MDKAGRILYEPSQCTENRKRRLSARTVIGLLVFVLLFSVLLSFALGRYPVGPRQLVGILLSRVPFVHIEPFWSSAQAVAVWNVRLPRIWLAVLVGGCLSAAGSAYQGVFQNPIASPDILGASAGAGFGAALAIFLGLRSAGITAFAFVSSLITVLLVFIIGNRVKGEKTLGLVLAGVMISSLLQAGTSFIKLAADPDNKLPSITYWLMGSLSGANNEALSFILWPMLLGLAPLWLMRWRLNVITMGDEEARAMGVDASKVRLAVVFGATLVTAASVSLSGLIGWVGLIIPHMARRLVGSDFRTLMPASALMGGTFLLLVDNISRNFASVEIPIGILTAVIGAPVFLLLILRRDARYA